ncbi:BREX-2 system adenine-specific DNA-methyltransferase PglX [Kitasatospora sp. NBC_01302]|uniref:BREX-2 system adenine-specific DNA-methyltransferase PglX n=1 Tax=Kitasatospora sp. NBC_01302 TaxID=2903575 RepID=UPI002E0E99E9|nr:BREX-2 system adenine-specific DNA-methyltransferase PglX [Kitasatospora sp. NBC_01302]
MIDRKALLADLIKQVKAVEVDLGSQVKAVEDVRVKLRGEYDLARKLGRTAATWNSWLDERITQVAVAWVLGTVFVRFCEDNELIPEPYLAGASDERRDLAAERYAAYVDEDADPTYRGWLEKAFAELGAGQAGKLLFDRRHNPLFQIPLSHDGARALVEFWRERDEAGVLVHDFTDKLNEDGTEGWDTRFLGDLYQDLSEAARKTYALLQTPEFVEEFILDRAMDPAVREFGYEGLKMIDPTCGSGHFVLGAFRRLVRLWGEGRPGTDRYERVRAALDSVHGVDINPFAVAIARFRLLVAAMAAAQVRTLADAGKYDWPIQLAVGDSLIKARQLELTLLGEESGDELAEFAYATEDVHEYPGILEEGRYHVVVGNPPYITVKDKKLNALYRDLYDACGGKYAFTVPFAQRFFNLAKKGSIDGRGFGMVGQITANSFMKREFGTKLIEEYFAHQVELTEVVDTSGAYIPGHGTPTVILIGRHRSISRAETIRTIRSVQGEPATPEDGAEGLVWRAIIEQIDKPGSISQWVSVDDLNRERYFCKQPWILADGGLEMVQRLEHYSVARLSSRTESTGFAAITGDDEYFVVPRPSASWGRQRDIPMRAFVTGDQVRDWDCHLAADAVFPSAATTDQRLRLEKYTLWHGRQILRNGLMFGTTKEQRKLPWSNYAFHNDARLNSSFVLTFPFVATHNHFALGRGEKVFNRHAPVIKLPEGACEEQYLELLGLLNSSTACFWLKQVSHDKGSQGVNEGFKSQDWERFFEFTGTKLQEFPLPSSYPSALASKLDALAQALSSVTPSALTSSDSPTPTVTSLRKAHTIWDSTRAEMIAIQEELDWQVYTLYSLHPDDLRASEADAPGLILGQRAFEIVLARRIEAGEASSEWFKRHGSTPITEFPSDWPNAYKAIVQKRIEAIESSRAIGMIERPEYKRRWATEGWDSLQEKALRSWLLDRLEAREHWFQDDQPRLLTPAHLTDALSRDADFVSVAEIYAPRKELASIVADLLADEHVPFLPALRYKPTGLKKRSDWEHVWDLQRQEDAAPDEPAKRKIRDSIPVPPKYTSADFLKPSYWKARGKLDVPKERFISYATTTSGTPDLFGWAGWDHREQAQALTTYFTNNDLSTGELTPYLAGLLELQPWLSQWHGEFDAMYGSSPADFFAGYRAQIQGEHGLTDEDLRAWRPAAATRRGGRTAKK